MKIITDSNIKLGGNIAQVNMPYALSCRKDAPCFDDCYCTHGNMAFSTVRNSHMEKYRAYKDDPIGFFSQIDSELKKKPYKYFRWHSSGDIVDDEYLRLMCKLARNNRGTHFLCFTKKYEIVNCYLEHHRVPRNLVICLSNWGSWHPYNPHKLPESYVDFGKGEDELPEFGYECTGNCGACPGTHCWHMKKGDSVIFHKH